VLCSLHPLNLRPTSANELNERFAEALINDPTGDTCVTDMA
jgi:hypothetical protein